ncbi:exodeoxyribonuclease III [Acidiphilium sp. AL]|uniref:Exodeoxyribonuclease III n=1 Tax=Acidiphilium iwatense TaxID=768198 RepID=A0ABS9DT30_9PROT|nr:MULTISPECIES: exodeoxyribonuclease III [Acidiphilium]MCF3945886.1 exodeoxyribonuclease III [Acidiphilium iwatense]MCU4159233.1 exodeoxyribonuclease III [Acidiphilium sp. AL]
MNATLTISTWNINSVRLRQDLLPLLVNDAKPDIICLQETKVPDPLFPADLGERLGLPHVLHRGMKGYNGVAVFSRLKLSPVEDTPDWCLKSDCRHLAAYVETGKVPILLHNFYVPAGGDIPDRDANPKYGHKLDFIAEARAHFAEAPPSRSILVGDLNIAPLENDVWSHKQLLDVVSHTPPETEGLNAWRAQGFVDAVRHFVPPDRKLYTWWSYRNRDWRASDRGRRLDHVWVSQDLESALQSYTIHKDARDWPRGSDHVPVTVTLKI